MKEKLIAIAVLTTLADPAMNGRGSPSGVMYAGFSATGAFTLDDYTAVLDILKSGGYITVKHHFVELTKSGRELGEKLNAEMAATVAADTAHTAEQAQD